MQVLAVNDYEEMSKKAADEITKLMGKKANCVLGLATGSTPVGMYEKLVRRHKKEGLDFSRVTTFNLDEYQGLAPEHPQSYYYYMQENLFKHINIGDRFHIPNGLADDVEKECRDYEEKIKKAGGIDLQILGVGNNGHIGFNEPGTLFDSVTHLVSLTEDTIKVNGRFFESSDEVPRKALTMGIKSIMGAKKVILLASGIKKAEVVAAAIDGPIDPAVPVSCLQQHPDVLFIIDREAASKLKR